MKYLFVFMVTLGILQCAQTSWADPADIECFGKIKTVDSGKCEVVFQPEENKDPIPMKVDDHWAKDLKEGDIVHVTYRKDGADNKAVSFFKHRPGFRMPDTPKCTMRKCE